MMPAAVTPAGLRLRVQCVALLLGLSCLPVCAGEKPAGEAKAAPLQALVVGQPVRLEVHPPSLTPDSPQRRAQVVVTGVYADGSVQDLTRAATFMLSDPRVASVAGGWLAPLREGKTDLLVKVGGREADRPARTQSHAHPRQG